MKSLIILTTYTCNLIAALFSAQMWLLPHWNGCILLR